MHILQKAESLRGGDEFLIDSNVLVDIAMRDPKSYGWSALVMAKAARTSPLHLNPLIYAEVSVGFDALGNAEAHAGDPGPGTVCELFSDSPTSHARHCRVRERWRSGRDPHLRSC